MNERALILGGFTRVALALAFVLAGSASAAILTFVFLATGTILLLIAFVRMKAKDTSPQHRTAARGAGRADRVVWVVAALLGGVAIVASIVAATVSIGEATAHAVGHLAVGLACLALFVAIAAIWHPERGSGRGSIRGMVLLVLGVAAFGSFIESLGGSGYDAANLERRVDALASLHSVGILFGPVALLAIPVGALTLLVIACSELSARARRV